jgi:hypothetical protein
MTATIAKQNNTDIKDILRKFYLCKLKLVLYLYLCVSVVVISKISKILKIFEQS